MVVTVHLFEALGKLSDIHCPFPPVVIPLYPPPTTFGLLAGHVAVPVVVPDAMLAVWITTSRE